MATAKKLGEVAWQHVAPKGDGNNGSPSARSGHSISYSPTVKKNIVFGGCGISPDGSSQQVFNETWFLSTDGAEGAWELVDVMGDVPQARWRHTATLLPSGDNLLVFGGLNKGKRFNDTYVFDVSKLEWNIKECNGTPPPPRSHHTANLIHFEKDEEKETEACDKVAIVGGYGGPGTTRDFYMDVHMLELDTWTWNRIQNVRGPSPRPRSDHCTCLTRGFLVVSGGRGWGTGKTDPGFFNDINVLDVKKMEWVMPAAYNPEDENPIVWPTLPTALWNHMAMSIDSVPSDHMFFFGGQKSPREFSNTVSVMECNTDPTGLLTLEWETKWSLQGAPPMAREDAGIAYDTSTCDLVFFGGWRQRWWSDVSTLNVAGVVGPSYAVMGVEPATGPLTGGTPITLTGLRFKESPMVTVRFTDGKREATGTRPRRRAAPARHMPRPRRRAAMPPYAAPCRQAPTTRRHATRRATRAFEGIPV